MAHDARAARKTLEAKLTHIERSYVGARVDAATRGQAFWQNSEVGRAEKMFNELVSKIDAALDLEDVDLSLVAIASLANVLSAQGRAEEAEALQQRGRVLAEQAIRAGSKSRPPPKAAAETAGGRGTPKKKVAADQSKVKQHARRSG